jgi:aminopeptidase N
MRVFGKKSAYDQGWTKYASELAPKLIDYFESYFGEPDALPPKIDLVAFPDYSGQASENTGLNGFRETNLYYSEKINTNAEKQGVAFNLAHELSHYVNAQKSFQNKTNQKRYLIFNTFI